MQSSLPLKSVEVDFAVDSSGFTTLRFTRWFDVKDGKPRAKHHWVKVHLMCGVTTNIVTAVEVGEPFSGGSPFFPPMVKATAQNFTISEVSADKAYDSIKCVESAVRDEGAALHCPENHGDRGSGRSLSGDVPLLPVQAGRVPGPTTTSGQTWNRLSA